MPVVFLYCDKCQNYKGIYRKHTARGEDCENRWKYFLTLKDGTMYQLEDEKQYSIVLESWKYFKFIMIDVKDNGKKE